LKGFCHPRKKERKKEGVEGVEQTQLSKHNKENATKIVDRFDLLACRPL